MRMARAGCRSVLVSIFLASLLQSMHGDTDANDVQGLRLFYSGLNSPRLVGWNDHPDADPCRDSWQGITCDVDGRNIARIELPGLDLNGSLGWFSSLNRFEHLTVLDLSNNRLGGMIPYNLPINIEVFNLQRNRLNKNIPWSLGQLLSLTELRLAHNNLTGPISDNFARLRSLITLDVSDNSFTGSIPRSLGSLSELSFLYLQDNRLDSGLESLAGLNLQSLDIRKNAFNGNEIIPSQLMAIPSFQYSEDEFNASAPLGQSQLNLSLTHAPEPAPAAHPPTAHVHAPGPPPTALKNNHTKSFPPPSYHNFTTGPAPSPEPEPHRLNVTYVRSREDRASASFWSPVRIAGLTVASILAVVASVLTFLYFKWKGLEEHRKEESHISVPRLELGSLYPRQLRHW